MAMKIVAIISRYPRIFGTGQSCINNNCPEWQMKIINWKI